MWLLHLLFTVPDVEMTEYAVSEGEALKKLNEVSIARREVEIVRHRAVSTIVLRVTIVAIVFCLCPAETERCKLWREEDDQQTEEVPP